MNRVEGLVFRKIDLHVHTPKSLCYSDPSVTPEQIVDAALAAGLEAIAITDHNTVEAVDDIRRAAMEKNLRVFPGVELSTKGGHVLALFGLDTPVENLEDFLGYVGVPREGWGDATAMTGGGIEEVFQKIDEQGGIAIAAHIERWPSGFLETDAPSRIKMRIHSNRYLSALEISVPQNKDLWNAGLVRNYPKKYACVQGSDAHALSEIGRRPVYVQMEQVGLEALRLAILNYETRIVFSNQLAPSE
ncbi:PHP domain-containing protein [Chloroflexota bacterium]